MTCILGDLKQIVKLADKLAKDELKKEGIVVLSQHIIIFHLIADRHVKFNDLQSELSFSKSTLSDAINKYEEMGLIAKFECDLDKRNLYLELTDAGKIVWGQLIEIDKKIRREMFSGFKSDESIRLEAEVHKILENLK